MIRSTKIRWSTYREDMENWEFWDKKEECLNRSSRSREREADKIRALRQVEFRRSRSRSILEIYRETVPEIDMKNIKMKEETRSSLSGNGYFGFTFLFL